MALSGGQQQRLCIARTIAPAPEVILLDEPTSSLDPQGTQRIEELLYELKRDFTIVIVTHNMQQAARVSDTTSFFYLGDDGRDRRHPPDLHRTPRRADRGLHHGAVRMTIAIETQPIMTSAPRPTFTPRAPSAPRARRPPRSPCAISTSRTASARCSRT